LQQVKNTAQFYQLSYGPQSSKFIILLWKTDITISWTLEATNLCVYLKIT